MPVKCGLFVRDRETPVRIGLRGGGHSRSRTRLSIQSTDGILPVYKKGGWRDEVSEVPRGFGGKMELESYAETRPSSRR